MQNEVFIPRQSCGFAGVHKTQLKALTHLTHRVALWNVLLWGKWLLSLLEKITTIGLCNLLSMWLVSLNVPSDEHLHIRCHYKQTLHDFFSQEVRAPYTHTAQLKHIGADQAHSITWTLCFVFLLFSGWKAVRWHKSSCPPLIAFCKPWWSR